MPIATRRPSAISPSRSAPVVTKAVTTAKPGERYFLFDIPYELREMASRFNAKWDAVVKAFVYQGPVCPDGLDPYRSQQYSWGRLKEDELNGVEPDAALPTKVIELRPHQKVGVAAILAAEKAGRSGFLLADDVGLGKTMECWAAILEMEDADTVLISCPLAVVAHWRRTIQWMGDGGKKVCVINYERLSVLFDVSAQAARAMDARKKKKKVRKVRTQKGLARYGEAYNFDVVVFDESHRCRNLEAARTKFAMKLSANADFTLWLSATAGQTPLELAYLSRLLAESTGAKVSDLKDFEAWCQLQGIGVSKGAFGKWIWRGASQVPAERVGADEDLERVRAMLFDGRIPAGIRRTPTDIEGWPEINRILLPVDFSAEDRGLYVELWGEFRRQLELEATGRPDPKNALVMRLRFRQKASLLRTAQTVEMALELLGQGKQVAISVAFLETLEVIRDALVAAKIGVAEIHGRLAVGENEVQRMDFQHGRKTACVYTVEEGISLHQGEYNDAPRVNIVHDLRWSAIQMKQVEGRTHRDGKFSQIYWMVGADTVEEGIAEVVAGRIRSMSKMQGDDATADDIEKLLDVIRRNN